MRIKKILLKLSYNVLIYHPIFITDNIKRTVWLSVKRINVLNLGLKGLRGVMNVKIQGLPWSLITLFENLRRRPKSF